MTEIIKISKKSNTEELGEDVMKILKETTNNRKSKFVAIWYLFKGERKT